MSNQYYSDRHEARVQVMASRRTHGTLVSVFFNALMVAAALALPFGAAAIASVQGQF